MYILVTCSRGLCIFSAMLATCTVIPYGTPKKAFMCFMCKCLLDVFYSVPLKADFNCVE